MKPASSIVKVFGEASGKATDIVSFDLLVLQISFCGFCFGDTFNNSNDFETKEVRSTNHVLIQSFDYGCCN